MYMLPHPYPHPQTHPHLLPQELKHAKTERQHKEEYEALAKVVNSHSAKSVTQKMHKETQAR